MNTETTANIDDLQEEFFRLGKYFRNVIDLSKMCG